MFGSLKKHLKDMLSGRYGTVSSARVLMFVFSAVAIGILLAVFRHLMKIDNPALLAVWIGGLPSIGGILVGLVAAPYTVNKGANSISDLFNMMVAAKSGLTNVAGAVEKHEDKHDDSNKNKG